MAQLIEINRYIICTPPTLLGKNKRLTIMEWDTNQLKYVHIKTIKDGDYDKAHKFIKELSIIVDA